MILVRSGVMVTAHDAPPLANGAVAVSGESIADLGTYEELSSKYPAAHTIGDDRFLLIPGLINGHSHGRGLSSFQRGGPGCHAGIVDLGNAQVHSPARL
jgi:cytosine/adenosine deaminase-related metal-dependent hydrolase